MKPTAGPFTKSVLLPLLHRAAEGYFLLVRMTVENEDALLSLLEGGGKAVIPLWHQRFFGLLSYAKRFRSRRPLVMISRSRDGEFIADLVGRLGLEPVRGSSSRGGREALREVLARLKERSMVAHAVDGPRGPKGVVKAGVIEMARLSGAKIVPIYVSMSRAWRAASWDHFMIPKPFSRVRIRWGDPFDVPSGLDAGAFEDVRRKLEILLEEGHRKDDAAFGWSTPP